MLPVYLVFMRNHSNTAAFRCLSPSSLSSAAEGFFTQPRFFFLVFFYSGLWEDTMCLSQPSSWGWLRTLRLTQMYIMLNLQQKQGVNLKKTKACTPGFGCQKAARSAAQLSVKWGHARWRFCCFRSVSSQASGTLLLWTAFCPYILLW